jgi:hypothetical protein
VQALGSIRQFIFLIGILTSCSLAYGVDTGKISTTTVTTSTAKVGYHCLFIGHSFFIPVAKQFDKFSVQSGVANHKQDFVQNGGDGGSPGQMWKQGVKREAVQKILETGKVELFGMPYKNSMRGSSKDYSFSDYQRWIDYALIYNPDTVFFLGLPWGGDAANRELTEYTWANQKSSEALTRTVVELRRHYPGNRFVFANYGMAAIELRRLFEAGRLPDVATLAEKNSGVYKDSTGHASNILRDLSALIWLATLYEVDLEKSPLKLDYTTNLIPIAVKIVTQETGG